MGMRGAFRVAACVHMSLRRGATPGDIGTLTLVTPSSPAKLKGHVQSPTADYSAAPFENIADSYGQTDAKDTGMYVQEPKFTVQLITLSNSDYSSTFDLLLILIST